MDFSQFLTQSVMPNKMVLFANELILSLQLIYLENKINGERYNYANEKTQPAVCLYFYSNA